MDDEGIKFECLTKPYGFVAPDAEVWFQNFNDVDDFGNTVEREYMMTTGYLWTGQFEECKDVVNGEGKNQSMELDENSLDGKWSTNTKTGMDFFIINDATFSKLCILGDDVEPCFEGARVTAPEISKTFSREVDNNFKCTLFAMKKELKNTLKGGLETVENEEVIDNEVTLQEEEETVVEEVAEVAQQEENTEVEVETPVVEENVETTEPAEENTADSAQDYQKLENEYNLLKTQYSELNEKYSALVEFKNKIELEKKDELINSFYMLSDEDKADVIANKEKYSLDDIEAKLSIICVRKKVNFNLDVEDDKEENKTDVTTYSLSEVEESAEPWILAARETKRMMNN